MTIYKKFLLVVPPVLLFSLTVYSLLIPKSRFQQAKENLVKNPNDFQAHLALAEEFLKNNQFKEAEKELIKAEQPEGQGEKIMGQRTDLILEALWQKKRLADTEDIQRLIATWEKIIKEKPNYRDGYLHLALLYYRIFQNQKAQEYLQKGLALDPNYEAARSLEKTISGSN